MDLRFTNEQELLRGAVRELLERECTPGVVRALEDDATGVADGVWKQLASMELLGLGIPEADGGAGGSPLDIVILCEELGRAIAPTPHWPSCVMAGGALIACGSDEQRRAWLPRIARGEAIVSLGWLEPARGADPSRLATTARRDGEDWVLDGAKSLVPFGSSAERVLTLARDGAGLGLFLVDPRAPGASLTQQRTIGSDASYALRLDGARVPAGDRLGGDTDASAAWGDATSGGWIALAAMAVGGARRAHEMAVAYAKERVQFGKPIGAFQGIAHPLADGAMEIEGAAVLVYQAAWTRERGRPAGTLAAMAKLYACDVFKRVTKVGQQVLGGIGFTRDVDMQLYFRRAKQMELTWGEPAWLEERIAAAELDAERPFVSIDAGLD